MSTTEISYVTLRDGAVVPEATVVSIMANLRIMLEDSRTSPLTQCTLIELRDNVLDDTSPIEAPCISELRSRELADPEGHVHESVAHVARNALVGGPMDVSLRSPVEGEEASS